MFILYSLINGRWQPIESGRFEPPLLDQAHDLFTLTGGTGCFRVARSFV